MDTPQLIALDDVVLRDDLDPRLGQRDDDLIAQYADIFDALPPIEINQDNVLIDGWHRVRAAVRAGRTEIACVVVETDGDDDLSDRMWAANLKHGVQYTRVQRQIQGLKLHERDLKAKEIAERVGVGASSVYRWTKEYREKQKLERESEIQRLREEGMTLQEIADEVDMPLSTVARTSQISQMRKTGNEPESETEPEIETAEAENEEAPNADVEESTGSESAATDEEAATPEPEPKPAAPEEIQDHILEAARKVMGVFSETRPDAYVASLEASPSEWMTITDDSLSNDLERELLTSAAAMCLWQEQMIWYRGGRTSAFTDVFGKIGDVFVRGQSGQWSLVAIAASKLREIMRRFL